MQAWYDYCLINPSSRSNKSMADNRFDKRIIFLNKEKVHSFANAKSNEFFKKMMALNVLSLWSCKKAVSHTTDAISHGNYYSFIARVLDISLLIKHMTEDSIFAEKLGRTGLQNNYTVSAFLNLFSIRVANFLTGVTLKRYIHSACSN